VDGSCRYPGHPGRDIPDYNLLGLSKEYWRALFTIAAICTTVWLIRALLRIRVSLSVDDIVDRLRTESLALSSEEPQTFDKKLVIVKALYGHLDTRMDVTSQMNSAIRDGKLRLHVGNQLSGDPCRSLPRHSQGCRSDLSIWARGTDPNFS
jgi:hypothetical protein